MTPIDDSKPWRDSKHDPDDGWRMQFTQQFSAGIIKVLQAGQKTFGPSSRKAFMIAYSVVDGEDRLFLSHCEYLLGEVEDVVAAAVKEMTTQPPDEWGFVFRVVEGWGGGSLKVRREGEE